MAVEYNKQDYTTAKQILVFPDHYVAVAQTFPSNDSAAVTEDGRKIIKAGTIYPSNDANASGVVFNDMDVTNGDRTGAVIVHGFVKKAALPANPSANAIAALNMIKFLPLSAVEVALVATALTIANAEAKDKTHSIVVGITGTTFRPEASTLTNWTITGEATAKVEVVSITVSPDGKFVTINTKNSAATAEGSVTVVPLAAATSTADVPATATTIVNVPAAG